MRRHFAIISFLGLMLSIESCSPSKDKNSSLILQFAPTWGGTPLQLNSTYSTPDGQYINFQQMGLYLSHFKLVKPDNTEIEVKSAALMIYKGTPINIDLGIVTGTFKAIKFSIGLDSIQNTKSPADYPDDPVFSINDLYWDASRQHLFIQMDGACGTSAALASNYVYHIGFNRSYRTTQVEKIFSTENSSSFNYILNADIKKVFYGLATSVNANTMSRVTHSDVLDTVSPRIADSYTQIFSIQ